MVQHLSGRIHLSQIVRPLTAPETNSVEFPRTKTYARTAECSALNGAALKCFRHEGAE